MEKEKFKIILVRRTMYPELLRFFRDVVKENNNAFYSREALCENGLRVAVANGFVVAAINHGKICGMVRFYPNIRSDKISVYLFAVSEDCRKQGCVDAMLRFINNNYNGDIVCKCPVNSRFNNYYANASWSMLGQQNSLLYWKWECQNV